MAAFPLSNGFGGAKLPVSNRPNMRRSTPWRWMSAAGANDRPQPRNEKTASVRPRRLSYDVPEVVAVTGFEPMIFRL